MIMTEYLKVVTFLISTKIILQVSCFKQSLLQDKKNNVLIFKTYFQIEFNSFCGTSTSGVPLRLNS